MNYKRAAMVRIMDATDNSGGAKFPDYMLSNMKRWENDGLIELHRMAAGQIVARITDKGRKFSDPKLTTRQT